MSSTLFYLTENKMENRINYLTGALLERKKSIPTPALPFAVKMMRWGFRTLGPIAPKLAVKAATSIFFSPKQYKRPEWPETLIKEAKKLKIGFQNRELHGYQWGDASNPLVLLVHGWENEAAHFQYFVNPLLQNGFSVVAFDAPAHGNSRYKKQTNMFEYGLAVETICKHLGAIDTLIGHSMGAAASMYRFSKNTDLQINNMVLMSCPTDIAAIFNRFKEVLHLPEKVLYGMQHQMQSKMNIENDIYDLSGVCQRVKANNVLIVHDRKDVVVPFSDAERMLKAWPSAKFLFTENFGHNRIIREEEVISAILQFLMQK